MELYGSINVWIAIILAGIAGCVATNLFANWIGGVPLWAIARQWPKHAWSIIFAIPIPLLLTFGGAAGIAVAFVWLIAAPTVASKAYFGPKEAPWSKLLGFHAGYAIGALVVYLVVVRLLA